MLIQLPLEPINDNAGYYAVLIICVLGLIRLYLAERDQQ